jgi:hypothetical protein
LNSALKVEMVDKAMQTMTWRAICNRLSLGPEDRQKLAEYMDTRNKQVERENKRMEEMRNKQRLALMNIDNSDIKIFAPPPQLVLQRIMRQATREMLLDRTMYTDLMLCTSGDVLAARQYLHQHGLPRSWAGDWGDGMVELRESADDCPGPDQFEWKEDLMVTPPYESARRLMSPAVQTQTDFIQDVGLSNSGAIDPMMLTQSNANPKPTQDCRKYFTHWYPEPVDPTRTVPNFSWAASRHHGIVNLKVGRQRAAQIQQYERTGSKPYGWPAYGPRPSPVAPSAEIETPTRVRHNPIGPQFSLMHNTPGTQQRNIQYTLQPPTAFSRRIPAVNENSPLNRPLDGNRAFRDLNYAESQARFRQQMQQAQLSMLERQGKAQAERYDFQPKPRVSGVSAGGSQYRRTQPYAAVQNIATAQRMVSRAMPQTSQFDAFWYEHQRARAMGDSTGPMDSFIYSDPIIVPEETEDERMAQQPEGEKEEQHSSTGPSSHTDASEDEMMMIPIDSCSPSQ